MIILVLSPPEFSIALQRVDESNKGAFLCIIV